MAYLLTETGFLMPLGRVGGLKPIILYVAIGLITVKACISGDIPDQVVDFSLTGIV
jgi:hypothetical protein